MPRPPKLTGVLETALYCDPDERASVERLLSDVLDLPVIARWHDGTALRVGSGVVLIFDRTRLAERDEPPADHGSAGPGHVCLVSAPGGYEQWKSRLAAEGVEIVHEETWPRGGRSFYFKDPAGNLLEIADSDIWPEA